MREGEAGAPRGTGQRSRAIEVVLVDSLPVVRAGLSLFISGQPGMHVAAEASTADRALEAIRRIRGRSKVVVLVGLNLSGAEDGFWLIRSIRETYPSIRILACASSADPLTTSRALFSGADGVANKSAEPEEFLDALRSVADGGVVLQGLGIDALGPITERIDRQRDQASVLTARERDVLRVAAAGLTARQKGSRLGLRERTVTTHLCRIYRKLGVSSRVGALSAAADAGVLSLSSVG
jgi:two-component system response regulator DevR